MKSQNIDERFIALEMYVADLDRTLKDLSQVVADQAATIDRLENQIQYMAQNVDIGEFVRPLSEEVPPPHY